MYKDEYHPQVKHDLKKLPTENGDYMLNESPQKMLLFTVSLCFICALLVSGSHVLLRPYQEYNRQLERSRNILSAAGLLEANTNILEMFNNRITPKLVDLRSGKFAEDLNPITYNQRKAVKSPSLSSVLPQEADIAGIKRRPNYAPVYLVTKDTQIETIVLPVYGYGLWSTMYGFLALKQDAKTILNLIFYEHGETPGLGAEITNLNWLIKWKNKVAYNENKQVAVRIVKSKTALNTSNAQYEIDAIAGATITSRGVENLMRFWLSEQGFGVFLARLQKQK